MKLDLDKGTSAIDDRSGVCKKKSTRKLKKGLLSMQKISSSILRTLLTNGTSETLDSVCHEDVLCKAGR